MAEENYSYKENENQKNNSEVNKTSYFYCQTCNKIPLIVSCDNNLKIIKYCRDQNKIELINPSYLLLSECEGSSDKDYNAEFICYKHKKEYINYCIDCDQDICYDCTKGHEGHKIYHYFHFIPSEKDIQEGNKIIKEMKTDLEKFKEMTKETIKIFEDLIKLKKIVINDIKSINVKRQNFFSLITYHNLLKFKPQLNEIHFINVNPLDSSNIEILKKVYEKYKKAINPNFNIINNDNNILKNPIFNDSKRHNNNDNYQNNYEIESIKQKCDNFINIISENINYFKDIFKNSNKVEDSKNNNKFINKKRNSNNCFQENQPNENFITNKKLNFFENSELEIKHSLIANEKDRKFLSDSISTKMKMKIKKIFLCYRASTNGDRAEDFHTGSDGFKNLLVLIKTNHNKKIGGFTSQNWQKVDREIWKKDDKAFMFSLDSYKIINSKKNDKTLFCHKKFGPVFGNDDIHITDEFFSNPSVCHVIGMCDEQFYVSELEVYVVEFE